MELMSLMVFMIISASCTVVLARAEILERPKGWIIDRLPVRLEEPVGSLMYCSQCLGFWAGLVLSVIIGPKVSGIIGVDNIMLGFVSSYCSTLGDKLVYGRKEESD
jgi:hypothetical protein